ncbi:glycosyltransferase family 2 protein [Martelella alba]|uniref:Glycosyltransferase family 2 protein n=1 Tax=Martelella alba TaxID=2590451 RepID=A0A506U885_9HYPH|nr:glycosyltransferase family 2 protein [Martelella alba]TPW28087.1 glycosyltransferase family 2 protein [Martelella alba]
MSGPTLSIISAVHNKADVLAETVENWQSHSSSLGDAVEFVLVDDASVDGSYALAQSLASEDKRIKLHRLPENRGPAIAFNTAAGLAGGRYLLAADADDLFPDNAIMLMLSAAEMHHADLVYGRSKRTTEYPPLSAGTKVELIADPFAFAVRKKLVRMGFLAEKALWIAAGGADETIFIQDQSLPLRLSCHARCMAYIDDYVYYLRPAGSDNLSRNTLQQQHDRFLALAPFLKHKELSEETRKQILRQMVSSSWKRRRETKGILPFLSPEFLTYTLTRMTGRSPSPAWFEREEEKFRKLSNIRRPAGALI